MYASPSLVNKHGKIFDCATCGKGFHRKVGTIKILFVSVKFLFLSAKFVIYARRQRVVKVTFEHLLRNLSSKVCSEVMLDLKNKYEKRLEGMLQKNSI